MNYLYVSFFHFIGFIIIILINYYLNSKIKSPAFMGFSLGYGIYFMLIPSIMFLWNSQFSVRYELFNDFVMNKELPDYLFTLFIITVSYLIVILVYLIFKNKYIYISSKPQKVLINEEKFKRVIKYVGYFTLFVGGGSFVIFIISLGGISNALTLAEYNRSHTVELTEHVSYGFSLFSVSARILVISPYMFLVLYMLDKSNRSTKFLLALSFIINSFYLLYNAGRAPILIFSVCILYILLSKINVKFIWTKIISLGIICMPLLGILENIFNGFHYGTYKKIEIDYFQYIYEFSHPYRNVLNMRDIVSEFDYKYGLDYITAFLNMIPGINNPASYANTSLYFRGSDWAKLGGIPNDFITFNYIQLGIFTLIGVSLFFGYLLSRIDYFVNKIDNKNIKSIFIALSSTLLFSYIPNADLGPLLRQNISFIVLVFVSLFLYKKIKIRI